MNEVPQRHMTATEVMSRYHSAGEDYKRLLRAAVMDEKARLKNKLREALARKDIGWVFTYCVGQRADFKRAVHNQLVYGQSEIYTSEDSVTWVLRYMRRLGVFK